MRKTMIEHSMPTIGREEERAVIKVLRSKFLAEGQEVHKFEQELCAYIGAFGAVATSTGTLALNLALVGLGITKNDEIIVPSYVCRSVLNAILSIGARPVLSDVSSQDYNISFDDAKTRITKKTKAIIVPHMFGCPAQIDKFKDLGILVIEDCAHAIGAEYKGRKVGSWGDLSIFSFEGTKYITTGEGGMILSNSRRLLNILRKLKEPDSLDYLTKYTYRMTSLQAAVGRVQLRNLEGFITKRKNIAKKYDQAFALEKMKLPAVPEDARHVFQRYMVQIGGDIQKYMRLCEREKVKVKQPVKPYPLHRYLGLSAANFPNTEYIMKSAVSLPIYPSLTGKQVKYIIAIVKKQFHQSNPG
jgi:perosamine synthetase